MKNALILQGESLTALPQILSEEALQFLAKLHRQFNPQRLDLLEERRNVQKQMNEGKNPDFLAQTSAIRQDPTWQISLPPLDLQKRWVEITGPTDKKMLINALNSGANIFMADFEDANSPSWKNMIEGQANLKEAVAGTLRFTSGEGKEYQLNQKTAVLMVRPRGWHLDENHCLIDGEAISASLFDFGLFFFHNAQVLLKKGSGPYFYLPKIESYKEARLWNEVFLFAQKELGIPSGTIKATVLIETIRAAFEMEEILYELRKHSAGLNAGRWDYIFSIIKKFQERQHFLFPDRAQITMTVPFMRAYTHLLVKTCHRRNAYAIGGMAAFIPSRKDHEVNALAIAKVQEDKLREISDGFDGTWVAHPDLVSIAQKIFSEALGKNDNQLSRKREDVQVTAQELINFEIPGGKITEEGVRKNINIALQYLSSWLYGIGAVAIFNLMEDAATAEISRAQLWQWIHHHGKLADGRRLTAELYRLFADEEQGKVQESYRHSQELLSDLRKARELLDQLVLSREFIDFLTLFAEKKRE